MKFRSTFTHENRKGSGASAWATWHRQALAMGTAAVLASSPAAPAWAAPAGAAASTAAGAAKKLAAVAPVLAHPTPAGGCQLNSRRGKVQHVVTIIFDNTHFKRDPARDGSTLVPSDLEQMPHLLLGEAVSRASSAPRFFLSLREIRARDRFSLTTQRTPPETGGTDRWQRGTCRRFDLGSAPRH